MFHHRFHPRLDSTAVGFFAFLNATFNMTEKEEVDEDMPGLLLSKQLKMKHPIVMIPGIVTWQGEMGNRKHILLMSEILHHWI